MRDELLSQLRECLIHHFHRSNLDKEVRGDREAHDDQQSPTHAKQIVADEGGHIVLDEAGRRL